MVFLKFVVMIGKDYEMLCCEFVVGVRFIFDYIENWNWLDDIWMVRLVSNEMGEGVFFLVVLVLIVRGIFSLIII